MAPGRHFVNLCLLLYSPAGEYKGISRHTGAITTSDFLCSLMCKNTNSYESSPVHYTIVSLVASFMLTLPWRISRKIFQVLKIQTYFSFVL